MQATHTKVILYRGHDRTSVTYTCADAKDAQKRVTALMHEHAGAQLRVSSDDAAITVDVSAFYADE